MVSLGFFATSLAAQQANTAMQADLLKMIRAANANGRALMPWAPPVPELDQVVHYGKRIVPYLIALLPDDPDTLPGYEHWDAQAVLDGRQFDERAEQHAAVALCRIYLLLPETCPKYSNRATHEQNKDIKRFWLKVVADNP